MGGEGGGVEAMTNRPNQILCEACAGIPNSLD